MVGLAERTELMSQACKIGLLVLVAVVVLPFRAVAAPPTAFVVLVGVGEYTDPGIQPRKHGEADARALYDLFTDKQYLDVDRDNVMLLLGGRDNKRPCQPATKANIVQALRLAVSQAGKDDLVIFGFFGQASQQGLFGSDVSLKEQDKTAVTLADIAKELEALKSDRYLALLDVSYQGFDGDKTPDPTARGAELIQKFLGSAEKPDQPCRPGRLAILASNNGRPALDLEKQGLFASVLLDGLKGAADKDGYEPDGLVTANELIEHLERRLPELAKKHGTSKEDKEQQPRTAGCRASNFPITLNPAVTAKAKERQEKLATVVQDKKLAAEMGEEGARLLRQMPRLPGDQDLRKAYQKLADGTLLVDDFTKTRERLLAEDKLLRADAASYASKVMQAIRMIRASYVKELDQGQMVAWAGTGLCLRAGDKRIVPELRDRFDKVKNFKEAELLALLVEVRERLGRRSDLGNNRDVDFSLRQVVSGQHLDSHSTYIDARTVNEFKRMMTGNYTGIGVRIGKDDQRDLLRVVTPVKGSPAYNAGIRAGDWITTITREVDNNGKKLDKPEVLSTKGLAVAEAMSRVLGAPGTAVKLTIERPGADKPMELTITRGDITEESIFGVRRKANDEWDHMLDADGKIGYIRLTQFAENSAKEMKKAIESLKKQGARGLVLDLRNNPGGLLQSAVEISGLFIDDGLVVSIRPRTSDEQKYYGDLKGGAQEFPMVCLVNGNSASASEVVSACLQDHKRALIVGERSYGKGSVQNIVDFKPTGGQLKFTTATFWRPSGKNLDRASTGRTEAETWGVTPDKGYVLKLAIRERNELSEFHDWQEIIRRAGDVDPDAKEFPKDRQLEMGMEYLRGQIKVAETRKAG
jgi:C-terminal peptidase prc